MHPYDPVNKKKEFEKFVPFARVPKNSIYGKLYFEIFSEFYSLRDVMHGEAGSFWRSIGRVIGESIS